MSDIRPASTAERRILGCLYGQATGDAMGMPSELWAKRRIINYFGWIERFLPGPKENIAACEFNAAEFTDDTHQCIALMDALNENNGVTNPLLIARHILLWARGCQAFEKNILGPTSKASLIALEQGQLLDDIAANGVTNGAAMRVAPMGCLLPTRDKAFFIEQVRLSCLPTHKSDIAIAGAVVIAWAISRAIESADWSLIKTELVSLANETQRHYESTFSPLLGNRIQLALEKMSGETDHLKGIDRIYTDIGAGMDVIESVPAAIALVDLSGTQPMKCAMLAANLGGDTDTIGAMATAICGALHGIDAFPEDAIHQINQANNIDFTPYAQQLAGYRFA
ncbi:ADP-ribosylglycohydrolase family protein [Klebsiella indica]|uniref:ADP-ribosylglycohydrolase family protein n=1 Tax=Klebsiella indica TaxID=2582917 RepID=A0A5R9LE93_9ENTR|nr:MULTISPECIES: ADP-ribosylglycohydrolase family protein [Klebsiella]TLV12752.1 ADP-ribosylglycohydrolase family protein [Klebsiella indica]